MKTLALGCSALFLLAASAGAQIMPSPMSPSTSSPPTGPAWISGRQARIEVLDKVSQDASKLTVPVGSTARFGALAIIVRRCVLRPPDMAPDSAAWLKITEAGPNESRTLFTGWMIASAPSLSALPSPLYDVHVLRCQ